MRIGIAVFAYNRAEHLEKTLEGLKDNEEVKEIYIFQDGLKTENHRIGWENTRRVIENVDWCRVTPFFSEENKGLSRSIREGIDRVLQENDAIIVLEDDCVPTSNFINYMIQCFEKYRNNKRVYAINGYSRPVKAEKSGFDVYFMPRFLSWGWGTWKDRWSEYAIDNDIWERIKNDKDKSLFMAIWGGHSTERIFYDRLAGKNDSWAVYWALKIFESKGVCATPYNSFIQNIGCDGTGVHCGKTDAFFTILENEKKREYALPNQICFSKDINKEIISLYGGYTGINEDGSKPQILVYGIGNYFYDNEKYVNDNYYIKAFVDLNKNGYYAGKEIIKPKDINLYQYDKIIIMIQNIHECCRVKETLKKNFNIASEKITIGMDRENGDV